MNKLSTAQRTQVIAALVEGAGMNSVNRMTGVGEPTILRLLANLGKACQEYQDRTLRNLTCKRIQVIVCGKLSAALGEKAPALVC